MEAQEFITMIGPAAQASARTTGVPASFTVAQAALESGWCRSLQSSWPSALRALKGV
jgi:flagellum-specific peptidoglycan hydrolase FlgJ